MKEISIFIDESGDFGEYNHLSPYYIVTMVFHDQENGISNALVSLENELSYLGYPDHCLHAGPIIRMYKHFGCELYNTVTADNGVTRYSLSYKK